MISTSFVFFKVSNFCKLKAILTTELFNWHIVLSSIQFNANIIFWKIKIYFLYATFVFKERICLLINYITENVSQTINKPYFG